MKKRLLLAVSILISLSSIHAQDISGSWNGILKVQGIQLKLVFNISKTDSAYTSTMDSPDQGAKGIPVASTTFKDSVIKLEIPSAGILYEGTLDKENVFVGTFKQAGISIPLNLTKKEVKKEKLVRPQEPLKPYPYYTEDVKFENTDDGIVLAGTLTLPQKDGNFPAVILISGSGAQNRDEELLGHKPFLVIADHLTRNGIAVLRFDDRGTAGSTGDFKSATSVDFSTDVKFAISYLQQRKEIDNSKIGLIGHSEGGMIAPMVAAGTDDVSFIVLLAGPGIRGDKLLLLQQELINKASGMPDAELQQAKAINKGAFEIVLKYDNSDSLKLAVTRYIRKMSEDYPDMKAPSGMSNDDYIALQVNQLTSPWMSFFIKYDPALVLEHVKCPVLAINGEKDLQVPAKVNLEAIKKALTKGGNKTITTKELLNLNHLFQDCDTGSPSEYATIEQTISPVALAEITNWILAITTQSIK